MAYIFNSRLAPGLQFERHLMQQQRRSRTCRATRRAPVTVKYKDAFIRLEGGRYYVYSHSACAPEDCVHVCDSINQAIDWIECQ